MAKNILTVRHETRRMKMVDERKNPFGQPCVDDDNDNARNIPLSEQHRKRGEWKDGWNDPTGWDRPMPTPLPPDTDD